MRENRNIKPASEKVISLYCHVGEALCTVQYVEDALSHSIVLKGFSPSSRSEADRQLEKHQKYTLGRAIGIASDRSIYNSSTLERLQEFLKERNWLVHGSIVSSPEITNSPENTVGLIRRIRDISREAHQLLQVIEEDLIDFAEANGKDMSRVKAAIRKHYT